MPKGYRQIRFQLLLLFLLVSRALSLSDTDYTCYLDKDDESGCPLYNDECDNPNLGGSGGDDCRFQDCLNCNYHCRQFDADCYGCVNAKGCYYCPGDGTCVNSNLYSSNKVTACTDDNDLLSSLFGNVDEDCIPGSAYTKDPLYDGNSWMYNMINVVDVWETYELTGNGVKVRINDNGVYVDNLEFLGRFDDRENSCNDYLPNGNEDHGTAVAGILLGNANNDLCATGIAPAATFSSCNFFAEGSPSALLSYKFDSFDISQNSIGLPACEKDDDDATIEQDGVVYDEGCPFTYDNPDYDPCGVCEDQFTVSDRILSDACAKEIKNYCKDYYKLDIDGCLDFPDLVFEGDCNYDKLPSSAIAALEQGITEGRNGKGTIFVFASGNAFNKGDDVNFSGWTNSRYTITVGAVNKEGFHADFSSGGAALMVTAPSGDSLDIGHILTAGIGENSCANSGQGTSFSCPIVSGAVALMLEANSNLSWRDVQGILAQTSRRVDDDGEDNTATINGAGLWHSEWYGFGIVDAKAAVEASMSWNSYSEELQAIGLSEQENAVLSDTDGNEYVSTMELDSTSDGYPDGFIAESTVVLIDLSHYNRGDLEIELVSPSQTLSTLHPGKRPEDTQLSSGQQWKLMTVRNWGENPTGTWQLKIRDLVDREGSDSNVFRGWSLIVYGRDASGDGGDGGDGSNPTRTPTNTPSRLPSMAPTESPTTRSPTKEPSKEPTKEPTGEPTNEPTKAPTIAPTKAPTFKPSLSPTVQPTFNPTTIPTNIPTFLPTTEPTPQPTDEPTSRATLLPTRMPTEAPTSKPTEGPTSKPTDNPTSKPTEEPTSKPSRAPTKAPTNQPTKESMNEPTSSPTSAPTNKPTVEPSLEPTVKPTNVPTSSPTKADFQNINVIQSEDNQSCEAAIPMLSNFTAAEGTISSLPFVESDASCLSGLETVGGWYQVIGNGKAFSITVCTLEFSINVGISVFTGSCAELECVEHQSNQVATCSSGTGRTISFPSESGTIYQVLVTGLPVGAGMVDSYVVSGEVPLDVFSVRRGLEPARQNNFRIELKEFDSPENSKCGSALPAKFENPVDGNTMGILTTFKTCQNTEKSGVWYTISGIVPTDDSVIVYEVNTCNPQSNFYNGMSVFRGDRCNSRECVDVDVLPCPNGWFGQQVYWSATEQDDYQIFVHSSDAIEAAQFNAGSFEMSITHNNRLPNDQCEAAVKVEPNELAIVKGTTMGAKPDIANSSCNDGGTGAWYHVIGTGSTFQVSTCSSETDHSTRLQIYSGECGKLTCINSGRGNQARCGENASTINFKTKVGADYYVLVSSGNGDTGKFGLRITETESPRNNECASAIPLDKNTFIGSTLQATNDFPVDFQCGLPMNSPGVWYIIEGKGRGIEISTCNCDFESAISIFKGSSCGSLKCITGTTATNQNCATGQGVVASFFGEKGAKYRVYIHGESESLNNAGEFSVIHAEFDLLEANEFCPSARPIPTDGSRVQVSTEDASRASVPFSSCGVAITNPGLWYTFRGNGQPFRITACSEDDEGIDPSISIFAANSAGCNSLTCLVGNTFVDTVCSTSQERRFLAGMSSLLSPALRFMTEKNQDYYIFVHGTGVGDFDLHLSQESFAILDTLPPTEIGFRYGKDLHRWIPTDTKSLAIHTDYLALDIVNPPEGNATIQGYIINYVPPFNFSGDDVMTVDGCNGLDCYRFDVTISIMGQSPAQTNEEDANVRKNNNQKHLLWLLLLLPLVLIPFGWPYRYLWNRRGHEEDDDSESEDSADSFAYDTDNGHDERGSLLYRTSEQDEEDSDPSGAYSESSSVVYDDSNRYESSSSGSYESSSDESSSEGERHML